VQNSYLTPSALRNDDANANNDDVYDNDDDKNNSKNNNQGLGYVTLKCARSLQLKL
jgi:hypothetical protein